MTEPFVLSLSRGTMRFFSTFRFSAFCKQPYGWGVLLVVFWAFQKGSVIVHGCFFCFSNILKIYAFFKIFRWWALWLGGFYWLFLWNFKEIKHQPFSMTQPFLKNSFWISDSWNVVFIAEANLPHNPGRHSGKGQGPFPEDAATVICWYFS